MKSKEGSRQRGTRDQDSKHGIEADGKSQAERSTEPSEAFRVPVDPVKSSIVLGTIAVIILASMFFANHNTPLFNLQLLLVILTVSLLVSVWLTYLIAGPGVAQLRGKVGDFAVDVGGPFAAFLATAVLLFYGQVFLHTQWWSQLPIQDPVKLNDIISEHKIYHQVIPNKETLKRLADVLEEYPPEKLERVTAQYQYLLDGVGSNPDFKNIVELIKRSEKEKLLHNRIIGQYCYFSRLDSVDENEAAREFKGRLSFEPDPDHPFIRLSGRSNGLRFGSEFFSANRDGLLYQWSVEEAGGKQFSIGFAKLTFTEFKPDEDRAVLVMSGKFTTFDNRAGVITLVRNIGGGGRDRDYCNLIASTYGFSEDDPQ